LFQQTLKMPILLKQEGLEREAADRLAAALRQDLKVLSSDKPFDQVGTKFPAGSLILKVAGNPADLEERLARLARETGAEVWLKLEGCNPTGSFKDRGMVVAVAKAVEEKARAVICASTGNTAASAAAYAARAGLTCAVVIPSGKIALGKLSQAIIHHARVLPIEGNFDQALKLVRELAEQGSITLVNSVNPYRIEGQKTGAFEIVDALGDAPEKIGRAHV
jgi:threonine synthase